MYGYDILCGISKATFEIPHSFAHLQEFVAALRFESSHAFFSDYKMWLWKPLDDVLSMDN